MDLDVFFILDALIVLRFYCYLNAIGDGLFRFAFSKPNYLLRHFVDPLCK